MTDSVRHLILQEMVAQFAAYAEPDTPGAGPGDPPIPSPPFFSVVALGPLSDADQRKRYSIGIVAGQEQERPQYPYVDCLLTVMIEFRITVNRDDAPPADMAERVLTLVKQIVMSNKTWDEMAIDTAIKGNEIDLTTYGDRSAVGVLVCETHFRHSHLDPTNPNPDP